MHTPRESHSDRSATGAPGSGERRGPGAALDRDWPAYYDAVEGNPARETALRAIALFEKEPPTPGAGPRFAIDLACGSGRDSLALLRAGWRVLALDGEAEGVRRLLAKAPPEHAPRLTAHQETFQQFTAAEHEPADLLNCSAGLAFCPPELFPALWGAIVAAIKPGGRFAGQFFGDRDEWNDVLSPLGGRSYHTRAEVEKLLEPFFVEHLDEVETDGKDAFGDPKHFHVFHIVARRL